MKTKPPLALTIIIVFLKTLIAIFLTYAVVFSIVCTIGLVTAYYYISKPIKEVQSLATNNPVETAFMADLRQQRKENGENDSLVHSFVPLDSISDNLEKAVIAAEDDGFYTHPGFDISAMLSALEHNRQYGNIKHGGSTITQQLAKNLFLSRERNFIRKYKELAYSIMLEYFLTKDRILELYLNYAQWGKNIFGCKAAANYYYKKPCSDLTRNEAARMAAILAIPSKLSPYSNSEYMGKRLSVIANNLYLRGSINENSYENLTGNSPPGADSANPDTSTDTDVSVTPDTNQATF